MELRKTSDYADLPPEETMALLDASVHGLSQAQVQERRQTFGPNAVKEMEAMRLRGIIRICLRIHHRVEGRANRFCSRSR